MFTGIVDHVGKILAAETTPTGRRLTVQTRFENLNLGESIALDGTCLTVTQMAPGQFTCDLSPETLALTISDAYEVGAEINLERALRLGDALGGHWVLGHVDGRGRVALVEAGPEYARVVFESVGKEFADYLADKGSITVNGVSLTVNRVLDEGFEVMLIPHTLERTNLRHLKSGQPVNLEFDYLAKLIVQKIKKVTNAERI